YVPQTQSRTLRSLMSRRASGYAASSDNGTTPHNKSVMSHSGCPSMAVEPSAVSASHGGVTCAGAPGIALTTVRHMEMTLSCAGSKAGATREPAPNRLRAATRLATTATAISSAVGLMQRFFERSSVAELNSSPVSSSIEATSESPASDRYRSDAAPVKASTPTRRPLHQGGL